MVKSQNNNMKRSVKQCLTKYFMHMGYSEDEINYDRIFEIETNDNNLSSYDEGKYTDIYVYSDEISLSDFFSTLEKELDKVVSKFDPSAYFDAVNPGQYMARVYWK